MMIQVMAAFPQPGSQLAFRRVRFQAAQIGGGILLSAVPVGMRAVVIRTVVIRAMMIRAMTIRIMTIRIMMIQAMMIRSMVTGIPVIPFLVMTASREDTMVFPITMIFMVSTRPLLSACPSPSAARKPSLILIFCLIFEIPF